MAEKFLDVEPVIGDYKTFLDSIFASMKAAGFGNDEFLELDHIGYQTGDIKVYEEMKEKLMDFSESYTDRIFNGRPILVCRLKTLLVYGEFKIEGLEVLAPKEGSKLKMGLEHAEFVTKLPLGEFLEKHKDTDFDTYAYSREPNPELIVRFGDLSVKFHTQTLLKVRGM